MHHPSSHHFTFINNNAFESGLSYYYFFFSAVVLSTIFFFNTLTNASFPTPRGLVRPVLTPELTSVGTNVQHTFYKRPESALHAVYGCVILLTLNDVVTARRPCSYQERAAASILLPATFRALIKNNAKNTACKHIHSNCVCKHGHINPRPRAAKSS